jgi:hypothetical protein
MHARSWQAAWAAALADFNTSPGMPYRWQGTAGVYRERRVRAHVTEQSGTHRDGSEAATGPVLDAADCLNSTSHVRHRAQAGTAGDNI